MSLWTCQKCGKQCGEAGKAGRKGTLCPECRGSEPDHASSAATAKANATLEDIFARMIREQVERLESELASLQRPQIHHIHLPKQYEPIKVEGRQHAVFERVVKLVHMGVPVMLVGPAGSGKTTIAQNVAKALGLDSAILAAHEQMTDVAIKGYQDAHGRYIKSAIRPLYEHGGVSIIDESDAARANMLVGVNALIENDSLAWPDAVISRHENHRVIACANTWGNGATREYVGRNALDKAFLDRFVQVFVDYDTALEQDIASQYLPAADAAAWCAKVWRIRENVAKHGLKVIVSPRTTIIGARMLANGFSEQDVINMRLNQGMSADTMAKVLEGVR